jgi:hypothetical protein
MLVSSAKNAFDEVGGLRDEAIRSQLRDFVAGFVAFIGAAR